MYEVMFVVKVYILWKFIHCTIHWNKPQMLKIPLNKINVTKNALLFLLRALNHHSFTLIWDSYMSWSTRFVSLKVCVGFSIFYSVSFLLKFIFLFNKKLELFDFKVIIPYKIKIIENHAQFYSQFSNFKLQQELWEFNDICVSWSFPQLT